MLKYIWYNRDALWCIGILNWIELNWIVEMIIVMELNHETSADSHPYSWAKCWTETITNYNYNIYCSFCLKSTLGNIKYVLWVCHFVTPQKKVLLTTQPNLNERKNK